ncbi:uncharacterized protein BKCO1_2800014 [Diplodia corticola]|uniref:Caib baif family enzyme n=1 Tax=Diplodia corticola TaxID=236234 RepID=A0A1J9RM79_9PEZI|nr:uncharacterized protein BKCO1_2800014 [Diplodia corticola]OJD33683.1 hypothetical protein BKCO1_2800014 [Diplodia corticola]
MGSEPQLEYSVPRESEAVWRRGILANDLVRRHLPQDLDQLGGLVRFEGDAEPSIPVNWRWAESISALKALEATMVNRLLVRKYGVEPVEVTINTDHASLFVMSPALARIVDSGGDGDGDGYGLDPDTLQRGPAPAAEEVYRLLATSIYKTGDGRCYHTHGDLDATATLAALGLPASGTAADTVESAAQRIQAKVAQWTAAELDEAMNEQHGQAGTVAWSADEYLASAHGQANSGAGLYELQREGGQREGGQRAGWWAESGGVESSARRPLGGLKVLDLSRVIAGPTITRSLAELGASVMRVTSPHLPDHISVHRDLNWGKWNASLHLRDSADRDALRRLIQDADVVVDGYRPGALARLGFGRDDIFALVRDRERGIVHLRENCYGWHGPWAHRSGWQGISDACCGVSLEFGRAMGLPDEAVTPPFPNSDHCTGVIGCVAVLHALMERGEHGGSYGVDVALNYYSHWLVRSCGAYPADVWNRLWSRYGKPAFRHYHNTRHTVPAVLHLLRRYRQDVLFRPAFFARYYSRAIDATVERVRPVARFKDDAVELAYNVGTRGNGTDLPEWPLDLAVEVVQRGEGGPA